MKTFAIVILLLGVIIFYIGIVGSQHQVMQILKGSASPVESGLALNPSGAAQTGGTSVSVASINNTTTGQTNTGGAVAV